MDYRSGLLALYFEKNKSKIFLSVEDAPQSVDVRVFVKWSSSSVDSSMGFITIIFFIIVVERVTITSLAGLPNSWTTLPQLRRFVGNEQITLHSNDDDDSFSCPSGWTDAYVNHLKLWESSSTHSVWMNLGDCGLSQYLFESIHLSSSFLFIILSIFVVTHSSQLSVENHCILILLSKKVISFYIHISFSPIYGV